MALSQLNQTISVTADTGKAIADLRKLQLELRNLNKELTAATKAGDDARAQAIGRQIATKTRQYRQLDQAIKATTGSLDRQTAAVVRTSSAFAGMGRNIGVALGGVRAMRFGFAGLGATLAAKAFTDGVDKINELRRASEKTGASTQALQSWEKAVTNAGGTAADAGQSAQRLGDLFVESGKKALEAGKNLGGPATLRGGRGKDTGISGFVDVLHGANPELVQFEDNLKGLKIDRSTFGPGAAEFERFWVTVSRALVDLNKSGKIDEANARTIGIFGENFAKLGTALGQVAQSGNLQALGTALGVKFVTPEQIEQAKQAEIAIGNLKTAFGELQNVIVNEFAPSVTAALDGLTKSGFQTEISRQIELAKQSFQSISDAADAVIAKWNEVDAWVKSHSGLFEKLLQGSPGATFQPGELGGVGTGNAAGGYISGPGTGTSDSILARLSNGEFVMRAAAVQKWGRGFMHGLNSFADGGLVGMPPIRFAEGGLIAGGGGTPVHLHLGSQSFALSGAQPVVSALVSEAHAQRMRSAGTKPSWFGSRAGGR